MVAQSTKTVVGLEGKKKKWQNLRQNLSVRHLYIEKEILPPYQEEFLHNSLESTIVI